jgi:hypothetical protein
MKGMDHSKQAAKKRSSGDYLHLRNAPEIHVSQPGKCPKCGMALIKEKAQS